MEIQIVEKTSGDPWGAPRIIFVDLENDESFDWSVKPKICIDYRKLHYDKPENPLISKLSRGLDYINGFDEILNELVENSNRSPYEVMMDRILSHSIYNEGNDTDIFELKNGE